jgi:hypothetical protein
MDTEMLVCDLPTFQQHYLPFDPAERDVDNVLDSLEPHTWGDLVSDFPLKKN